jgi:hypothetical protein
VFVVKLHDGVEAANKFNFLYDIGFVRTSKVKKNEEGAEEMINIRSELKTVDRISGVLKDLTHNIEYGDVVYDLAYQLLTSAETKTILDHFKSNIYESRQSN